MKYKVKRFSYDFVEGVNQGKAYIDSQVDNGLDTIYNVSSKITEDEKLKDLKPVKRYGRFFRDLSYLLKSHKKKKKKHKPEK